MSVFGKQTRESQAAFDHWNERFGHFENLHGVRQSIWEITERVQAAVNAGSPGELRERSRRFAEHAAAQRTLAEDAQLLARLLDRAWTGEASWTAQAKFTAFVTDAQDTARTLETNSGNLADEAQAFADLAAAMKPLPPMEDTRQWLLTEESWTKEFLANWEFENDRYYHAQDNLQAYEKYHLATEYQLGQVSTDYPQLPGLPPDSELSTASGAPDVPAPSGWPHGEPRSSDTGMGDYPANRPGVPYPAGRHGPPDDAFSTTTAASWQPNPVGGGPEIRSAGAGSGPAGGGGPGSAGGGFGPTGGAARGFGPTGATARGFGPTGSGHGVSGAGRMSGIGPQAGGARVAGTAQPMRGAGGPMGGGGAMGGGGRGNGQDDDQDYRGRGLLHEDDPDGLFGVGEPTVPPVIGEEWE